MSALLSTLCSCGGDELVGLHVDLAADGAGTVTVRALAPVTPAPAAAGGVGGAAWRVHAGLTASQGDFPQIAALDLGDGGVTFAPQLDGDRPGLRVTLRRGPDARWVSLLSPDAARRKQLARAYDPTGRTSEIGDVIRLEVRAPGRVIASGVLPTGRGVEADRDGDKATLLLPVRTALRDPSGEGDFVWDISWLK
ncbi:MAG: hypothetical protein ACON4Z_11940 [Planctomycetota bacterium]